MVDKLPYTAHFVYQRIHTLRGKPLHLATHLDLASRAFEHIYGESMPELDERTVTTRIAEVLRKARVPAGGSATVLLRLIRQDDGNVISIDYERTLLDAGYSLSSLRPRAVTYEYSIPFSGFPTGFQLSAAALFDSIALGRHSATRSVRREGDRLLTCGDGSLFGIRGRRIFTAPLTDGVPDSVERRLLMKVAEASGLDLMEEAIPHSALTDLDELFFADASGITSLSECDGAKFMSLAAGRLAEAMRG